MARSLALVSRDAAIAAIGVFSVGCSGPGTTARPVDLLGDVPAAESAPGLGAFSISLVVKDLAASQAFYGALGFVPAGGDPASGWLILRNGDHVIGLFQGMFDRNIITFNPGWSQGATPLAAFTDIREIQKRLEASGLTPVTRADPASTGPASLTLVDPDGNPVLLDQHVDAPRM